MKLLSLTLIVLFPFLLLAKKEHETSKSPQYPVSAIPAELKEGADAVIRQEVRTLSIIKLGVAKLRVSRVVTILNKKAEQQGYAVVYADGKLVKANLEPGEAYDANGQFIKRYGSKDVAEQSGTGNGQFVESSRYFYTDMTQTRYPYTITYAYTQTFNGFFSLPSWIINEPSVAVQKAELEVVSNPAFSFRYKSENGVEEPAIYQSDKGKVHRWKVLNLSPPKREPLGPDYGTLLATIRLAPNMASIQGYEGDVSDWEAIARYKNQFYEPMVFNSQGFQAEVSSVIDGAATDRDKVRLLYQYMQNRTRYVGIQLGIGGWEPFPPDYVHEKGYGDCKALSNYMRNLLRAAGITSHPVAIYAGRNPRPVITDFPSVNQFNHIILCVPLEQDTCWLECTSQQQPFGYLGDFTENRYGLLITSQGGGLIHTPARSAEANCQIRHADFILQDDGNAAVSIKTRYTGHQHEPWLRVSRSMSGRDLEEWVDERISLSGFYREKLDIQTEADSEEPSAICSLEGVVANMAKPSGPRIFLKLNPFEQWVKAPKSMDERTQDVIRKQGFLDRDTLYFTIPEGYFLESAPEDISETSIWGSYAATFSRMDDGRLRYTRSLLLKAMHQGPETYDDLRSFLKKVSKADRMQAVLVNRS